MRVPRTHCARSLSGVQMMTRSTRGSSPATCRAGRERIVRLEFHHRPDDDAERRQRFFEERELREQVGLDARAGLVAGPQAVAERLDHVIGRDGDVRRAAVDHAEHGRDNAADGGDFGAVARRAPTARA